MDRRVGCRQHAKVMRRTQTMEASCSSFEGASDDINWGIAWEVQLLTSNAQLMASFGTSSEKHN